MDPSFGQQASFYIDCLNGFWEKDVEPFWGLAYYRLFYSTLQFQRAVNSTACVLLFGFSNSPKFKEIRGQSSSH